MGGLFLAAVQRLSDDPSTEADAGYRSGLFVDALEGTAPRRRQRERPRYVALAATAVLCVAIALGVASWGPLTAQMHTAQPQTAQPAQVRR